MKPFDILVKDNFFTPEELDIIWNEIHILSHPDVIRDPSETGSAKEGGVLVKQNKGIFFQDFYCDVHASPMYRASRKLFEGYTEEFADLGFAESYILSSRRSSFLLSYYGDGDHYAPHRDSACSTVLYWFCKEPRAFTGGDIYFSDIDKTVEFKNNRMIIFPSWAEHEVDEVKMLEPDNGLNGRFCVTQFLTL